MEHIYFSDKEYNKIDFELSGLEMGEYENCKFVNCNFSKTNLSKIHFDGCEFVGCNLSLAELSQTTLRDIKFTECKLLGLHFENCDQFLFSVSFDNCLLEAKAVIQEVKRIGKSIFDKACMLGCGG